MVEKFSRTLLDTIWAKIIGLLIIVLLLLLLTPIALGDMVRIRAQPILLQFAEAQPEATIQVIIQKVGQNKKVEELVMGLGGTITQDLYIINALSAQIPAKAVSILAQSSDVRWISWDAPIVDMSGPNRSGMTDVVRDDFETVSYYSASSQGVWPGNWVEIGEDDGSAAGYVTLSTFMAGTKHGLRLQGANVGIQRSFDLHGTEWATLTFAYRCKGFSDVSDFVLVQVSVDGGTTWAELDRLSLEQPELDLVRYDLSGYTTSHTMLRFLTSPTLDDGEKFYIDFVQVESGQVEEFSSEPFVDLYLPMIMSDNHSASPNSSRMQTTVELESSQQRIVSSSTTLTTYIARDEFNTDSFSNDDGSVTWLGSWTENDHSWDSLGPSGGDVRVLNGELRLDNTLFSLIQPSVARQVDLSGDVTSATLSFDFHTDFGIDFSDAVDVEISSDGGANYTTLERITGINGSSSDSRSYDISNFASSATSVRFRVSRYYMGWAENFYVDNVQISYTLNPCPGCIDVSNLTSPYVQAIGAEKLWNESARLQGQNIGVAVVDTGIAVHDDLRDMAGNLRVIAQAQFNSIPGSPDDFYGHGSHVAGAIAGNGSLSSGGYIGVAPKANLIDVKVTDDMGSGTVADVIAGLQWIYDNKDTHNIKVVNMSLSSTVAESYLTSPLDAAVEVLWFNSIVVVVSSGNNLNGGSTTIYPPANDPFVLTVGASDDQGTGDTNDDVLAFYSAYGITEDGFSKPDIVAPGSDLISLLAADDTNLALLHPAHMLSGFDGNYYFRMSGTSMASAVATGAVALLLQDEPNLTPDQVKYRLMTTARPLTSPDPGAGGAGALDIYAAVHGTSTESSNTGVTTNQLLWTSSQPVIWDTLSWDTLSWDTLSWDTLSWDTLSWEGINWNSVHWDD